MVPVTTADAIAIMAGDTTGEIPATTGGLLTDTIAPTGTIVMATADTAPTAIPIMVAVTVTDIWP